MDQATKGKTLKTSKNLYERIISFSNLLKAAKLAQRGKRFKESTAQFNFNLEKALWKLHQELADKIYQPGKYYNFEIYEPKKRMISAAPYRDRVLHHAIHNILEPLFDPAFIFDSYATRKGKGTHKAIDRAQSFAQKNAYVLKCDIRKYFPSIHHEVLMSLIKKRIVCENTLWLVQKILDSHFVERDLHQSIGIPIGNLTSQFFANIYLNGMDHFLKEEMKFQYYLRYMDDFLVFSDEKNSLWQMKKKIVQYLEALKLKLHEGKCRIFKTKMGFPFLGMMISPDKRRLKRENILRFKKRMKKLQNTYGKGEEDLKTVHQSVNAWLGYSKHANTIRLRELLLEDIVFQRQTGDES